MPRTEMTPMVALDHLSNAMVTGPRRQRSLVLSSLEKLIGQEVIKILRRYLSASDVIENGAKVRCVSIREARTGFSSEKIKVGVRVFAPAKGKNSGEPLVMMRLAELVEMIEDARTKPSLVEALAPSEELPVASPLKVHTGRRGRGPRLSADTNV